MSTFGHWWVWLVYCRAQKSEGWTKSFSGKLGFKKLCIHLASSHAQGWIPPWLPSSSHASHGILAPTCLQHPSLQMGQWMNEQLELIKKWILDVFLISQKMNTAQISINRWMGRQNTPFDGIIFSHEEMMGRDTVQHGWTLKTCKVKEVRHKRSWYDSVSMKCQE